MEAHSVRLKRIRKLALLLTALSFLVILVSAYIRLSGAGLGCEGWPGCYGQLLVGGAHPHTGAVRILHRVTATSALLLTFFTVWHCVRPTPIQPVARHATRLLVLMILLTLVGIWSADAHRAWASLFNILGGIGLVSLSWRMVLATTPDPVRPTHSNSLVLLRTGLVALAATLVMGASIGARYAAVSCASVPVCAGIWWPAAEGWAALNPFVNIAAAAAPGDAGGVTLHLLHRYFAVATLLLLGAAGLQAQVADATRTAGRWLLVLLLAELALGGLTVVSGFSLWLAIAHGVCAAAVLAAAVQLKGRSAG